MTFLLYHTIFGIIFFQIETDNGTQKILPNIVVVIKKLLYIKALVYKVLETVI